MAAYQIKHTWSGRVDTETRRRKDTAEYLFRHMARNNVVAMSAGLDTIWGWKFCELAGQIAREVYEGVPIGWSAAIDGKDRGETLTISRIG